MKTKLYTLFLASVLSFFSMGSIALGKEINRIGFHSWESFWKPVNYTICTTVTEEIFAFEPDITYENLCGVSEFEVLAPSDYFITTWKTDNPGISSFKGIQIPAIGNGYNYDVSWKNDGVWETGFTGTAFHTYGGPGTYTVAIRGNFPRIYFNNEADKLKILSVKQWGTNQWTSMEKAFFGCSNLTSTATDTPNLSGVSNLSYMFAGTSMFNANIGSWNVGNVTDMSHMFYGASSFNQNLNNWNVKNVTNMSHMFYGASSFNQNLNNWNVGNVTNMSYMFYMASSFNQNLNNWNVGNVTDMSYMFMRAFAFNGDISNWNVSNVTSMNYMFSEGLFNQDISSWNVSNVNGMSRMFKSNPVFNQDISGWDVSNVIGLWGTFEDCTSFNQDIGGWDVSSVLYMSELFKDATAFNQDISGWDVSSVQEIDYMFANAVNFNQDIGGWDVSSVTLMNYMFGGAANFNQDIGDWDVSNVYQMEGMFAGAVNFNQDLSGWDVGNVNYMSFMFNGTSSFNQNLGSWTINEDNFMNSMFLNSGMDCDHYSATLYGWNENNPNQMHGGFYDGGTGLTYGTAVAQARADLNSRGWAITGDSPSGLACNGLLPDTVTAKVLLQGALVNVNDASQYDSDSIMRDDIRFKGLLPATQPYGAIYGYNGTETVADPVTVFGSHGDDSVVDWVLLELRDANNPATVVATRAALVQKDGDIVDVDGVSSVSFTGANVGSYYLAVRHRNHLGAMSKNALDMTQPVSFDFRTDQLYTIAGRKEKPAFKQTQNGNQMLWAGDVNHDDKIVLTAQGSDKGALSVYIKSHPNNVFHGSNFTRTEYSVFDSNMNGISNYSASGNDTNIIQQNIKVNSSGNIFHGNNYVLFLSNLP